ncbi:MAG TPA: ribonuclease T2 [Candidatus Sulfotelmatobacter sp.]|jgi:ribonuclease T2
MKRASVQVVLLCLLAMIVMGAGSSKHHGSNQASKGQPGVFDYYLLTLSWSPEFCYSHSDKPECQSGHLGFVVHGLWPQYAEGYPEHCSNAPGLSNPAEMKDIMPDAGLVAHEWTTHGTCSGLEAEAYFKQLRQAFESVKIPNQFKSPQQQFSISPQDVKSAFFQANPGFGAGEMNVSCGNNFLTAVSFCMTKDLKPTACQNLRDCRANVMKVPPVR